MSDLIEQLRAAIEQTEWIAEHAVTDSYDSRWREKAGNQIGVFTRRDHVVATFPIIGPIRHVVLHDPAAVLRRCAADRKLLDLHSIIWRDIGWLEREPNEVAEEMRELPVCDHCVPRGSWFDSRTEVPEGPCQTIRILAEGYGVPANTPP